MSFGTSGATVSFGQVQAIHNVTFTARRGDVTMVVGGDGAGKSTLLRALVGLVPLSHGSVTRPDSERLGFLPTGAGSWRNLTVDQNIAFVGTAYDLPPSVIDARSTELLERAGLAEARSRLAGHLSGGMRTKLGFCLAMLSSPELLVLDEPTTGVDPVSRVELWRLISETAAEGTAVAMSSTYMDEAERASAVYLLDAGSVLLSGNPDSLIAQTPGEVTIANERGDVSRSWRSGAGFREWWPEGAPPSEAALAPTLEDVAIVAKLRSGETKRPTPDRRQ